MNKINEFIKMNKVKNIGIDILNYENTIKLIKILIKNNILIYGFDGFEVNDNLYQINQNYSRDYSSFSKEDSYKLVLEYFLKTEYTDKYYSISYKNN